MVCLVAHCVGGSKKPPALLWYILPASYDVKNEESNIKVCMVCLVAHCVGGSKKPPALYIFPSSLLKNRRRVWE